MQDTVIQKFKMMFAKNSELPEKIKRQEKK